VTRNRLEPSTNSYIPVMRTKVRFGNARVIATAESGAAVPAGGLGTRDGMEAAADGAGSGVAALFAPLQAASARHARSVPTVKTVRM
jgi:hypothetical protein